MGRHAGFLALGVGKATGATVTLIPEEFGETTTLQAIADVLEGSILKRRAMGRGDGVAVVAEGLAYRLGDCDELERLLGKKVPRDAAGHPRLAEFPLARMLTDELIRRFEARGDKVTIVPQTIGYMLRCAAPIPFDMAYCRDLGNGAVRLLVDESRDLTGGVMVTIQGSNLVPMTFAEMVDPKTNRTRVRLVDVHSDSYRVARAYMIRLEEQDLRDPVMLAKLSAAAKMSDEEFRTKFRRAATRLFPDANGAGLNVEIPAPSEAPAKSIKK
jgi:6-phosphofructokinase 1